MIVKESFHRGEELARELRYLPANVYNRIRLLLARSSSENVFVPIRSIQYQAVIDEFEIIFVDGFGPRTVEVAWQGFKPQTRRALNEPVPYQLVSYHPRGNQLMQRLQGEFTVALVQLEKRLQEERRSNAPTDNIVAFQGR